MKHSHGLFGKAKWLGQYLVIDFAAKKIDKVFFYIASQENFKFLPNPQISKGSKPMELAAHPHLLRDNFAICSLLLGTVACLQMCTLFAFGCM